MEAVARAMPRPLLTAGEHLSADVSFRFLPQVYRRARSMSPGDRLARTSSADLRRAWPLSGVLSDLEEGPKDVGDLGGTPGLYTGCAERLARDEKPAWMPNKGSFEVMSSWCSPAWAEDSRTQDSRTPPPGTRDSGLKGRIER